MCTCVGCWEAVREVAGRPPPIDGHCMVRFDSHRAAMYGGTSGNTVLDSLYIVDLETRVRGFLMQCAVCMCGILLPNNSSASVSVGSCRLWSYNEL